MGALEEAYVEYGKALRQHRRAVEAGDVPPHVIARRVAAVRHLHALEDPWQECGCVTCRHRLL